MYGIQIPHPSSEVDEVGSRLWKSLCHHEGALALLKLRQQHGPPPYLPLHRVVRRQVVSHYTAEHSTVSDIYLTTYLLQIRTYILRGIPIPDFLQNGAHYGEEGPALEFDSLMVRVAALRARSLALFSGKDAETCSDCMVPRPSQPKPKTLTLLLPRGLNPYRKTGCLQSKLCPQTQTKVISLTTTSLTTTLHMAMPQSGIDTAPFVSLLTAFVSGL
jgi:hypothetical protein